MEQQRHESGAPCPSRPLLSALVLLLVAAMVAAGCTNSEERQSEDQDQPEPSVGPAQQREEQQEEDDSNEIVTIDGISNAIDVSVGPKHACALLADGAVSCWGANGSGQLGDDTFIDAETPVSVEGISDATTVSVGDDYSCAVLDSGTISCWGDNTNGQLGNGGSPSESATPVAAEGISNATMVSAGDSHSCAVLDDGSVACWGNTPTHNAAVQASETEFPTEGDSPAIFAGISNAVDVSVRGHAPCALLDDGSVRCWIVDILTPGEPISLGSDPPTLEGYMPRTVEGLSSASAISTGPGRLCAVLDDGAVVCAGPPNDDIVAVEGVSDATAVIAGYSSCALSDGTVACWRADSESAGGYMLAEIGGVSDATTISGGYGTTCVVTADGRIQCWGFSLPRNDADASASGPPPPTSIKQIDNATAVASGDHFTCVLLDDGAITCWEPDPSAVFDAAVARAATNPEPVEGLTRATAVSAGDVVACAVLDDGTVTCWGGVGRSNRGHVPVAVQGISTATDVAVGFDNASAVLADGSFVRWQFEFDGAVGDRTLVGSSPPAAIDGISAAEMAVTPSCAILAGGVLTCRNRKTAALDVVDIPPAKSASVGDNAWCAVLVDGEVLCGGIDWGDAGRLEDGTGMFDEAPTTVATAATRVSVARGNTCVLHEDGGVWCWYRVDPYADVGDWGVSESLVDSAAIDMSARSTRPCAVLDDGSVLCWSAP